MADITIDGLPANAAVLLSDTLHIRSGGIDYKITGQELADLVLTGTAETTGEVLKIGANLDVSANIGKLITGGLFAGAATLSHSLLTTASNYSIYIGSTGEFVLHAPTGESVFIKIDNNTIGQFSATEIIFTKDLSLLSSISYASSASKSIEIGASNSGAVDSGKTYKWNHHVAGDQNGQNWFLQYYKNGGSGFVSAVTVSESEALFAGSIRTNQSIQATTGGTYGTSSNKVIELGFFNDASVNNGATKQWRQYVSGNALGQNWFLQYQGAGQSYATAITATSAGVTIAGSLSKSSGSFRIPHPLKEDTHELVHSFVESPQADNIYRGKVNLVEGRAIVNIDEVAGMTEGTFTALNREIQVFTTNESGWNMVRGSVIENILTIETENNCEELISWMVIGERQDKHMYDTDWTDENGKVIVEPEIKKE